MWGPAASHEVEVNAFRRVFTWLIFKHYASEN